MPIPKPQSTIDSFYTRHKPGKHSAHSLHGDVLVPAKPTEIELVQALEKLGIDLQKYDYKGEGDEKVCVMMHWWVKR